MAGQRRPTQPTSPLLRQPSSRQPVPNPAPQDDLGDEPQTIEAIEGTSPGFQAPPMGQNTMVIQQKFADAAKKDRGTEAFYGATLLTQLLEIAESEGASDLHLVAGAPPCLRINGKLVPVEAKLLTPDDSEAALRQILTDREMERFYEHRALDCTHTTPDGKNRFRVSAYVQRGAISVVFRRIPNQVMSFHQLGLPPAAAKLHAMKDGMILCVGPTGCGKSTTLATIIDQINENFQLQHHHHRRPH